MTTSVFRWKAAKLFDKMKRYVGDFFHNRLVKTIFVMLIGFLAIMLFMYLMVAHTLLLIVLILLFVVGFVGLMIYDLMG